MRCYRFVLLLLLSSAAQTGFAHTGVGPVDGVFSGFVHPLLGPDHLLAMLSVGLWAVFVSPGSRRPWVLPLAFMAFMLAGGAIGAAGLPWIGVEAGIALSVLLLGGLVAGMARVSRPFAVVLVGLFALFHGHAHGAEMAEGADFAAYALGFVGATGLLHLAGIVLGRRLLSRPALYRACGGAIGGLGALLLAQAIV